MDKRSETWLGLLERMAESTTRGMLTTMTVEERQAHVQGMKNVMCLQCCEPRDKDKVCHCENDD